MIESNEGKSLDKLLMYMYDSLAVASVTSAQH